jgi:hypothetical protein
MNRNIKMALNECRASFLTGSTTTTLNETGAKPSICLPEPFTFCHSERSEESQGAPGKPCSERSESVREGSGLSDFSNEREILRPSATLRAQNDRKSFLQWSLI